MYIPHFLFYLSTNVHLGCFCILALLNNAEINMGVQISLWEPSFNSLDTYPEGELLDYTVDLFLIFWGMSILSSTAATPFYIPTNSMQGFQFFCLLINIWYHLKKNNHLDKWGVSHYGFELHFPDDWVILSTSSSTICVYS